MTTLNDAAQALAGVVTDIDSGITFFDTPVENHPPAPLVTGEILFRNLVPVGAIGRNAHHDVDALLTLTSPANVPGWDESIRRMRDYASPFGAKSILQAIFDDETLGGEVVSCRPLSGGLVQEQRVKFPDGDRWTLEIAFRIRIGA